MDELFQTLSSKRHVPGILLAAYAVGEMDAKEVQNRGQASPQKVEHGKAAVTRAFCSLGRDAKTKWCLVKSRMSREVQVRFCEGPGGKFPGPTRLTHIRAASLQTIKCRG